MDRQGYKHVMKQLHSTQDKLMWMLIWKLTHEPSGLQLPEYHQENQQVHDLSQSSEEDEEIIGASN